MTPFFFISFVTFLLLLLFSFISNASPTALVAPIQLDAATSLYTMKLVPPSPSGNSPIMLDLDNSNLWRDCADPVLYSSPSFRPLLCNETAACAAAQTCSSNICGSAGCYGTCNEAGLTYPTCSNYTCASWASITAIRWSMGTAVWRDTIALPSTDGRQVLSKVTIPDFAFLCTDDTLLKGGEGRLPPGVVGGTGLSRNPIALPSQISSKIPTISRKFGYCLPSSTTRPGVIFFGDGPYVFKPDIDVSTRLRYTPIISFSKEADSYFLDVKSISVAGVPLGIDSSLLTIKRNKTSRSYVAGTRFSSSVPYTQLTPSIYNSLVSEFKKAAIAQKIKEVAPISPFDLCFDASTTNFSRVGYNVPQIDIALKGNGKSKTEKWQIYGANSVTKVNRDVFCLAFQPTDEYESRSIIIGTYQQQEAFFQFDLAANRLGFVPSLPLIGTGCSDFSFT
ncbi:hypothetical protein KP509_15G064400 [Ceratopteris richardii]|uniref:Peptidase A1 domain-containing protein n=1 Tax=Ceratopteris richardii TaxID=49495 RepID=A0A8T2T5I5_CERRI|nr:hypothetical protein KP509_15G064400 [Ceratopteris richardii]